MPTPEEDKETSRQAAVADAKRLLRLSRTGALATLDADSGAPLATLVGVASDICGSPLFLMSSLARHSKNIERDPRVSLLLTSTPDRGDPLNRPRLTLGGPIERIDAPNARRRYIQRNPKAKLYASFADFALYRLRIENVHFNGGFGRADLLKPNDILASRAAAEEFAGEEARILEELETLDPARLAALAGVTRPGRQALKPVGIDAEGFDLASGAASYRVQFRCAATDCGSWREGLSETLARLDAQGGPSEDRDGLSD